MPEVHLTRFHGVFGVVGLARPAIPRN